MWRKYIVPRETKRLVENVDGMVAKMVVEEIEGWREIYGEETDVCGGNSRLVYPVLSLLHAAPLAHVLYHTQGHELTPRQLTCRGEEQEALAEAQ